MECKYCAQVVHIFKDLNEEELRAISGMTKEGFYAKGNIIINEGDRIDNIYIIHKGKIKVYKINLDGKEQILYILKDGDTFGENSIFKEQKATFYAEAMDDVKLCLLSKEDFMGIISRNPEIALKIMNYLLERLQNIESLVKDITTEDVKTRLLSMILKLADKEGIKSSDGIKLKLYLSREDIANLLGTTRETISRKLHELEDDGIIKFLSNKEILLKDIEKFKEN
ncbi:transcriptional regulator, Crp/Fnr family [Thermoanaerobacterium thermosaccharolyticum DSM 571]|uniref:Transcriptional regulator, Crp/Fnr family n=1 Tax=Thermoanaerobacterium thermosaccharolyticum (strain ATCC 7956 / DSM 571 / NCIMB 9385 / NCA 3814 / NCTC 13789 / WDCM 00135 / 2032) TaxID=580327 RepID=D9TNK5_THETC|nr:Crp/Fnr family transcriptional regulator [Thermoanaerobacterium thermosaccharolyticum]ADL68611.1 transcriptional regulator, Crp/Fnr family [Thermoanaerobacterium thermosaccharolyticum DSM 571]TCW41920.1 CRP/FNR family transcriptional regulator [Thermohydrogenium kirishiense]